jgi:hypothetical protein
MTNTNCCEYSSKTPVDGQYVCSKNVELYIKIKLRNGASCWLLLYGCNCYVCPILMKLELSEQLFEKYSNFKFNENPFCGSRVFFSMRTDGRTDGQTDMKKLIVTFRNFANAHKKCFDSVDYIFPILLYSFWKHKIIKHERLRFYVIFVCVFSPSKDTHSSWEDTYMWWD